MGKPDFGQYVAFITFMPPNLSDPRQRDADIDLYVSRDPKLMDLDPDVLDEAFRSTDRGGSEYITFEDAKVSNDEVFYIGVKSEDQMAAEFGLVGLSSSTPFGGFNNDGNLNMMPLPGVSRSPARYMASKTRLACSSEAMMRTTSFCSSIVTPMRPILSRTPVPRA